MATVKDILAANRQYLSPVPAQQRGLTCQECFGPVDGYRRCYSCNRLFSGGAPDVLSGITVPMTIVINPSPWYSRLKGYKAGMAREYRPVVASLAYAYMATHFDAIAHLLGGPPDAIAITPSKGRHPDGAHPLRDTLALVAPELLPIMEPVRYVGADAAPRGEYVPERFEASLDQVVGGRFILVEDVWVSGRTCLSTAGAMLEAGAVAVVVLPIARLVHFPPVMISADHPFFDWIKEQFELSSWRR
jgi:hypothetical protein